MALGTIDIAAQVKTAVTGELARIAVELQALTYENIGQGGSRGHSVDWFDAADGGGRFSERMWVGGKRVIITGTKTRFFQVNYVNPPTSVWVPAMELGDQATNSEVFDANEISGDLHLPGNVAG